MRHANRSTAKTPYPSAFGATPPHKGEGKRSMRVGHNHHLPNGLVRSSRKYLNTQVSGFGAACPRPQIEASRIAAESSVNNASSHGPVAISLTAFSVPARQ